MGVLSLLKPIEIRDVPQNQFVVVHPLDDLCETKLEVSSLGPMPMTASVRYSLMALRGYLILMMLLVLYHVIDLAGLVSSGH